MQVNRMLQLALSETASKKLKELIERDGVGNVEDTYLRVYVTGGGCSGFRYGMALDKKVHDGDEVFKDNGIRVVVDPNSKEFIDGSTVATLLSLLVILLFMSIALVDIIPRAQNDAEFATTESAISSFEQIRGLSQGSAFATGPNTIMPATTVPIPLGTQAVSPLQ